VPHEPHPARRADPRGRRSGLCLRRVLLRLRRAEGRRTAAALLAPRGAAHRGPAGAHRAPPARADPDRPEGIAVASRDAGVELLQTPQSQDPAAQRAILEVFYANNLVGKIWHSGGYDYLVDTGNQVRSIALTFSQQALYASQAQQWADTTFAELLTAAGVAWRPLGSTLGPALRPPRRSTLRGTQPLDGEDNQNLPDYTLEPQALDPSLLPVEPGADPILQPILVHYYAHNGGWFVGQSRGCPAGARLRVLWALHDRQSGAVLGWSDCAVRYVEPYFYTPNDNQLQDYLLRAEEEARTSLARAFLA
jgi:hypothetical protein